ncbi:MAG: hypothetical protein ACKVU4_11995 [Phycisphaerales bacterium]
MNRSRTCVLAYTALAAACAAGLTSSGSTVRIRCFTPLGIGILENPNGDGLAKIAVNEAEGSIAAHIHFHKLMPNTQYSLAIDFFDGGNPVGGVCEFLFTTNGGGNANIVQTFFPPIITDEIVVSAFIDTDADDCLTAGLEERLVGTMD